MTKKTCEQTQPQSLGRKVKQLRELHGMSQEVLATRLKVDRSSLCQAEIGNRKFQIEEVEKLADIFNMSVDQLLGRIAPPEIVILQTGAQKENRENLRIEIAQEKAQKFQEVLLYILQQVGARPNVGESVLYKLLYFIDFNYYAQYSEPLIGATYLKNSYGPTPIEFQKIVKELIDAKDVEAVSSKHFEFPLKKYLPLREPNMLLLNARELALIDHTLANLAVLNVQKISAYAHQDAPWLATAEGEVIAYELVGRRTH